MPIIFITIKCAILLRFLTMFQVWSMVGLSYKTTPPRLLELVCSGWRSISVSTAPPCWVWDLWLARVKYMSQYHLSNCQATWPSARDVSDRGLTSSGPLGRTCWRLRPLFEGLLTCLRCFAAFCLLRAEVGFSLLWLEQWSRQKPFGGWHTPTILYSLAQSSFSHSITL